MVSDERHSTRSTTDRYNKGPSKDRSTRTNNALYHKEGLIGCRVTTEQPKGSCLQHIQIEVTDAG